MSGSFINEGKVSGIVHLIEETKTYGQKGFRKRLVVLEQPRDRFTNYIPVEFTQDSCDTVDQLSLGDEIEVSFRMNGRKWQRDANSEVKYFSNAEAQGFKILGGGSNDEFDQTGSANDEFSQAAYDEDDDIPF